MTDMKMTDQIAGHENARDDKYLCICCFYQSQ